MTTRGYYREADHSYWMGRAHWPSVTQSLVRYGLIDTRWFADGAADRGRLVHAWAEQIDLAQIDERMIPDAIGGYVEAYRQFLRDCQPEYDSIEQPYWNMQLRYGARPDRGCRRLFGGPATLELKSGDEAEWHGVQLAGYERARPKGARWVVYLGKNGRHRIRQCRRADDHRDFIMALADTWANWMPQRLEIAV